MKKAKNDMKTGITQKAKKSNLVANTQDSYVMSKSKTKKK